MGWAIYTHTHDVQQKLHRRFGSFTPLVQWYNITFVMLLLLFLRTVYDIVKFEYIDDRMLSWNSYKGNLDPNRTGIPLSPDELDTHRGPLVIPSFLRVISLMSPMAGLVAFGIAAFQVMVFTFRPFDRAQGSRESHKEQFLHMVVVGMPLVFIVMALRATIREWAIMTGSAWLPYQRLNMPLQQRQEVWKDIKASEASTYTQDLEIASGFQFFAVWCFGQVCTSALGKMMAGTEDKYLVVQLGVLGLHAFVALGVVKTLVNVVLAVLSADWLMKAAIEPYQEMFMNFFNPVFIFATILSVVNMFVLGRVQAVSAVVPNVNKKFNATRALLLIGQMQLTVLSAATTDTPEHASKILRLLHKVPFGPFHRLHWWFGMNQARLMHSSLLCFECLIMTIVNYFMWHSSDYNKVLKDKILADVQMLRDRLQPLLPC